MSNERYGKHLYREQGNILDRSYELSNKEMQMQLYALILKDPNYKKCPFPPNIYMD